MLAFVILLISHPCNISNFNVLSSRVVFAIGTAGFLSLQLVSVQLAFILKAVGETLQIIRIRFFSLIHAPRCIMIQASMTEF